jgi:hypothetical protein
MSSIEIIAQALAIIDEAVLSVLLFGDADGNGDENASLNGHGSEIFPRQ